MPLSLPLLALRNLTYHGRLNLAVLLGVAVGSAVLSGALLVGDSLRASLRARVELQLLGFDTAAQLPRPLPAALAARLPGEVSPALSLPGSLQRGDTGSPSAAFLGRVTILGVDRRFPIGDESASLIDWDGREKQIVLSGRVAAKLGVRVGDEVQLTTERFSRLPRSSALAKRGKDDVTVTDRYTVAGVLPDDSAANDFNLSPNPAAPLNVYVPLATLSEMVRPRDSTVRSRGTAEPLANLFLTRGGKTAADWDAALKPLLTPEDFGLKFREVERREPPGANEYLSIESDQLVISPPIVEAVLSATRELGVRAEPTVVYIAESLKHGDREIPYPVVAGLNVTAPLPLGPFLPPGLDSLGDDEVILLDWKGSELAGLPDRTRLLLTYYDPEVEGEGRLKTAELTLRAPHGYLPLAGPARDKNLTPEIAGVTDPNADLYRIDLPPVLPASRIRERVPDKPPHPRGTFFNSLNKATPMAYVNLATAVRLFGSRHGAVTSIRVAPVPGESLERLTERLRPVLHARLDARASGFGFESVRERLLTASRGGSDFGGLFLGLSLFLIVAALMLVGLLFRLTLERRAKEIGLLLAVGYRVSVLRRLLLLEGLLVAVAGSSLGLLLGLGYNRLLLSFLGQLWPDPEITSVLRPHASGSSLLIGFTSTVGASTFVIYLGIRGLVKISPPALLRGETTSVMAVESRPGRFGQLVVGALLALGSVSIALGCSVSNPDYQALTFFSGGGLLLTGGLLGFRRWMDRGRHGVVTSRGAVALLRLGSKNAARNPNRSLLTASLLASAAFLLVAVESFRRHTGAEFSEKHGGSGGFDLIGESDLPVYEPLSALSVTRALARTYATDHPGYEAAANRVATERGLSHADEAARTEAAMRVAADYPEFTAAASGLRDLQVFSLRLRDGDDASCLNLFQAARPRVIGVPDDLIARGGFKFYQTLASRPEEHENPWLLLKSPPTDGALPVFCEQNTAQWMLKKTVGDELTIPGDNGEPLRLRIVGTLSDSPFQSELLMSDASFARAYPGATGYRVFLISTAKDQVELSSRALSAAYRSFGLIVQSTRERVAAFQSVIGAYLTTFQLLGGLGLLLGVLGLAVVVLQGIWERVGELSLLRAVGYRPSQLQFLVLVEHVGLLVVGLVIGVTAALLSIAPNVLSGAEIPVSRLAAILLVVLGFGLTVASLATSGILRVPLIPALRRE